MNNNTIPNEVVNHLCNLVARLEERVHYLSEQLERMEDFDKRLSLLEYQNKKQDNLWHIILEGGFKLFMTIVAGVILYKLGIHL